MCTEFLDDLRYPGESLVTTAFTERGGVTTLTITLHYESLMERGLGKSYDAPAELLA